MKKGSSIYSQEIINNVLNDYKSGVPRKLISSHCNIPLATIDGFARRAGILRTQSEANKMRIGDRHTFYSVNSNYFDVITSENSWILGLLWTDGNLTYRDVGCRITFASNDVDLLEKIKRKILYTGPVRGYQLAITDMRLYNKLLEYGLIPNKSLTIGPPIGIPIEFIPDFIRGCFDGDGCYYINKRGYGCCRITSSSENFAIWLRDTIKNVLGYNPCYTIQHLLHDMYDVRVSNRSGIKQLIEYLYHNEIRDNYLDRKYLKVMEMI